MIEAAGWIGMPESEFWETTPRYFAARVRGKQRDDRENWVMARQAAYWVAIFSPNAKKLSSPTNLGSFSWEQQTIVKFKEITPEQKADMAKFKEMALKLLN
jgi:hypothetical protein